MSNPDQEEQDTLLTDEPVIDVADTPEVEDPVIQDDSEDQPLVETEDTQELAESDLPSPESLTTPDENKTQGHVDESRYKSLQAEYTRTRQELKEIQSQFEQIQQERQRIEQEQQQQSKLKPFMPSHPRHGDFKQAKQNYNAIIEASRYVPEESRQAFLQDKIGSLPHEMQQALADEKQHRESFMERLSTDPQEALGEFFEERFSSPFEKRQREAEANARIQSYWNDVWSDKANVELAKSHPEGTEAFLAEALQQSPTNPLLYFQLKRLEKSSEAIKDSEKKAAHARAQQKARQGDAVVERDANQASISDISAEVQRRAKERGIAMSSPDIMDITAEVESELN